MHRRHTMGSPASGAPPVSVLGRWIRAAALWGAVGVGVCEMLVMTVELPWAWVPDGLASAVALIGFLAFLVLVGLTSLLGNLVVGLMVFVALWRGRGWPFWCAALAAAPYGVVLYRIVPKPW